MKTAIINNVVDTGIDGELRISLEGYDDEYVFDLNLLSDLERVVHLTNYLGIRSTDDLKGKTIRVIVVGEKIIGFGHPTDYKFFLLDSEEFQELTAAEIEKLYK